MPFVRITHSAEISPAAARQLAEGATRLMAEVLGKKPELTSVLVERAAGTWTIGAQPQDSAHLEALITAGTNSQAEKARFLDQAHALLRHELGALPQATYVVLRDIPADDWGYGGLSQGERKRRG